MCFAGNYLGQDFRKIQSSKNAKSNLRKNAPKTTFLAEKQCFLKSILIYIILRIFSKYSQVVCIGDVRSRWQIIEQETIRLTR